MKYLKFVIAAAVGLPLGLFVLAGAITGIAAAAFQGGFNTISEKWLDVLNDWMNV